MANMRSTATQRLVELRLRGKARRIRRDLSDLYSIRGTSIAMDKSHRICSALSVNVLAIGKTKLRRREHAKNITLAIVATHCNLLTAVCLIIARAYSDFLCALVVQQ